MHLHFHPQLESADERQTPSPPPLWGGSGGWGLVSLISLPISLPRPTLAPCVSCRIGMKALPLVRKALHGKEAAILLTLVRYLHQRTQLLSTAGFLQQSNDWMLPVLLTPELWNTLPFALCVFESKLKFCLFSFVLACFLSFN